LSIWRGLISDGMSIKIGETAPAARGRGEDSHVSLRAASE